MSYGNLSYGDYHLMKWHETFEDSDDSKEKAAQVTKVPLVDNVVNNAVNNAVDNAEFNRLLAVCTSRRRAGAPSVSIVSTSS